MYLILNVGSTGTGKSTLIVSEFINKKRKLLAYDFQNEYKNLPFYRPDKIEKQMRFFGNLDNFRQAVKNLPKGYNIIIEEASGIFRGQTGKDWIRLILSKRHLQLNFICNFHSLHRVPPDLFEYCDLLYLRKTGDFEKNIKTKFPQILDDWEQVQQNKNKYICKIIKLSNLTKF